MIKELLPKNNESVEEYQFRMSDNKKELNLSWNNISELLLENFNKKVSKDFIRHEYYAKQKLHKIEKDKNNDYIQCLIMNDIHIPYYREDIFDEIEKHKDVDYIIFGGDLIDCESCSYWAKWNHPSVNDELILAHEFISKINTIVNPEKTKIICIRGNHEYRYTRMIMEMHEKQLQKMLNPNLLSMLEKGFTVYERDKDITYKAINNFQYIDNWQTKLFNNLIIAHPTDFSNVEGSMCTKVADYFLNEHIAEKDDVIIFGHTHKHMSGFINRRQGVYVVENSCLCKEHEYANTGKLKFTPQNYGYTKIIFKENEKIDINNIKCIYLK